MNVQKNYLNNKRIMYQMIGLEDSTTLYLESIRQQKLKVLIQFQAEQIINNKSLIKRVTLLYFTSLEIASLYCICYLDKEKLTSNEYYLIAHSKMPLGKIFLQFNKADTILKKNISIAEEYQKEIAGILNLGSDLFYKKTYDYWVDGRKVGKIIEFFNEESLMRI